jgi:glycosyltransferase involved in cell wall biosynthesis
MKGVCLRILLTADPQLPVPPLLYGGIERVIDMLCRGLCARGHEVTLLAHRDSACPAPLVAWPGGENENFAATVRNSLALARCLASKRFDVVHSFSRLAYLAPILPLPIPKLMSYQREISARTTALARRLSLGTLHFSALSGHMLTKVSHVGPFRLIPNGVRLDRYSFAPSVAHDAPLVFLGRIEEIKGPHLAIEIARRAGARLVLAGNVPAEHRAWFDARIAPFIDGDRVAYVGPVDDAQKNELLGRARALLMPILWEEPFGIVMTEALACGTPVIGYARGSVPEIIVDGVTGFVVADVDAAVAATGRLPRIDRAACRARVERFYSDAAVTDAYVDAYRSLLGGDFVERKGAV